jgi:quercetin dioxygenase-like cupin family protein
MQTTIANLKRVFVLSLLITSTLLMTNPLSAQETITPITTHALAADPSKEILMYTVDFPAGFSSPIHRHNAQVSV